MVRKSDVESIDERGGIGLYLHRVVPTQPYAQGALLLMAAFSTSKQSDRCGLIALDAAHSKHCTLCGGGVRVVVCVCGWVGVAGGTFLFPPLSSLYPLGQSYVGKRQASEA